MLENHPIDLDITHKNFTNYTEGLTMLGKHPTEPGTTQYHSFTN